MSDGELLDHGSAVDSGVVTSTAAGNVGMSSGHLADSPHRGYYIWNESARPGKPQGKNLINCIYINEKGSFVLKWRRTLTYCWPRMINSNEMFLPYQIMIIFF